MTDFAETPLVFGPGEPDAFYDDDIAGNITYRGQDPAKERIVRYISCLGVEHMRVKALLTGRAGTGKTTLARIMAKYIIYQQVLLGWGMGGGYYEMLPAQLATKDNFDAFMLFLVKDPYAIVFIDEVHELAIKEALFHTLHDTGALRYPLSSGAWLDVPNTISWIAATTDPGELDDTTGGALRRRLEPEISLDEPTKDDLAGIIMDQGESDGIEIHPDAAYNIAERAHYPWQAKFIYKEAKLSMRMAGEKYLTPGHAEDAFRVIQLDQLGLLPEDYKVLRALLQVNNGKGIALVSQPDVIRFRMAEEAMCAIAGVDRITFKKRIQPKLMRLGLLVTIGGQCLTERAIDAYGWLRTA